MNGRKALAILATVVVLHLASPSLAAEAPAAGEAAKAPDKVAVAQRGSAFVAQVVMVKVNATVEWTNRDGFAHDVTAINGTFNSTKPGAMAAGAVHAVNFTKPGVYDYYCTLHSSGRGDKMWGRVIVAEEPILAMAGGAGEINPELVGVNWLAHWVGIVSFLAVILTLVIYYFVLKYGESVHTTDHRDRKEK